MSLFNCPICGKQNSIRRYDPSEFSLDIIAIQKVGLGRGKGFLVVNEFSILDKEDPTFQLIKNRILELCKAFIDRDCMSESDVTRALRIQVVPPRILKKRNQVIEDLTIENIDLKKRLLEAEKPRRSDDLSMDLAEEVTRLETKLNEKDAIIEGLTEDVVSLTEDRNHRLNQARELRDIAREQKSRIEELEELNVNLTEELII